MTENETDNLTNDQLAAEQSDADKPRRGRPPKSAADAADEPVVSVATEPDWAQVEADLPGHVAEFATHGDGQFGYRREYVMAENATLDPQVAADILFGFHQRVRDVLRAEPGLLPAFEQGKTRVVMTVTIG